ncbi:sigma factor-like helix-turn-helix DNA-binding protein [Marinoscillum luteum]|uniref:Sigma factor-like helix-turn-helix DNA-binding protein n=1 Tax=Marinoscillum luteum TaxID=861051 RepID=A0ABW7NB90_9BACT
MHANENPQDTLEMSELQYPENEIERFRSTLLPYAYNIIGTMEPARDVVEEVLVPFVLKKHPEVQNPTGYLVKSVINRSISHKNLLRSRLEHYPDHWLPEPVITEEGIYQGVDKERILSYSLLVLMEKLSPQERAVFILKNAFEFSHKDIGEVLGVEEEHSRQLYKRSKDKIHLKRGKKKALSSQDSDLLNELIGAMRSADLPRIKHLLKNKVESRSDGGPNNSAVRKVLRGKDHVSKLLRAIGTKYYLENTQVEVISVNHQPAIAYLQNDEVYRVMILEVEADKVTGVFVVINPEKLMDFRINQ